MVLAPKMGERTLPKSSFQGWKKPGFFAKNPTHLGFLKKPGFFAKKPGLFGFFAKTTGFFGFYAKKTGFFGFLWVVSINKHGKQLLLFTVYEFYI